MPSPTVENYLKALFALAGEAGTVSISALAGSLEVSKPSATNMARKLHEQGMLEYEKYKPLRLTDKGRKTAALIVRKHRLTEMFLVEQMGFGWEEVHAIAEQIEHVKSPAFFDRMDEIMGYPKLDPHGSPIPDAEGVMDRTKRRRLSDCRIGETITITGLDHQSNNFLHYLNSRGVQLGLTMVVIERDLYDGSVTCKYPGNDYAIFSKVVADKLLVE